MVLQHPRACVAFQAFESMNACITRITAIEATMGGINSGNRDATTWGHDRFIMRAPATYRAIRKWTHSSGRHGLSEGSRSQEDLMCHGAAAWLNAEPGNGGDTSSTVVHPEEPFPGEVTYPYKGTLFRVACITAKQPECARE